MVRLLFFHADWCGQCRMVEPIIRSLVGVEFVDMDISNDVDSAKAYNVATLPTVILEVGGEEKTRIVGARNKAFFEKEIERLKDG